MKSRHRNEKVRWIASALLLAPLSVVLGTQFEQPVSTLVGVIGHWTTSTDSTFTVDGAAWSGQSSAESVRKAGVRLFGTATDGFVANGTATGAFPLAIAAPVREFSNGTLRVQFKMVGGASDQNAGIAFNITPQGEYLYARYNTKDGDLALWRYVKGERQLIVHGTGSSKLALGDWHELVVTIHGKGVSASVAGVSGMTLVHTLDTAPAGRVGVWVKRDAITSFRRFLATAAP